MKTGAYTIHNNDLLLDGSERPYILRIRDLPTEDKPREKLLVQGPGTLSVQELLAVVLNVGTRSEGILEMSMRIVTEYGEKNVFSQTDATTMAHDLDIPLIKATQIVACGELGRRFFRRKENGAAVMRTARDVFDYTADMRNLPKEHLRGIYLNNHYQVIHDEIISIGTVDANIAHPREVFRPAFTHSAAAVILVHNHPSGVVTPSNADHAITTQLVEVGNILGIELVDHVIVTNTAYASALHQ